MKKLKFQAIFMALAVVGIIVLGSCEKEKTDVLSGTTWSEVKTMNMQYPTPQAIELVFDNDGNMLIEDMLNVPYTVDGNVMTLQLLSGGTKQHRFILDDDMQMLKILDNFHYYSDCLDIWDTVYFTRVN